MWEPKRGPVVCGMLSKISHVPGEPRGRSRGCVLPAGDVVAALALWLSTKPRVSQEGGEEEPRPRDVPRGLWEREGSSHSFGTSPAAA